LAVEPTGGAPTAHRRQHCVTGVCTEPGLRQKWVRILGLRNWSSPNGDPLVTQTHRKVGQTPTCENTASRVASSIENRTSAAEHRGHYFTVELPDHVGSVAPCWRCSNGQHRSTETFRDWHGS